MHSAFPVKGVAWAALVRVRGLRAGPPIIIRRHKSLRVPIVIQIGIERGIIDLWGFNMALIPRLEFFSRNFGRVVTAIIVRLSVVVTIIIVCVRVGRRTALVAPLLRFTASRIFG